MTKTTRAAVLTEQNRPLEFMDLDIPDLKPGQVLVELAFSGICRTQLNEVFGRKGPDAYIPHTLGHEGSGTVIAVGDGVNKVSVGDTVVASWLKGSGADVPGTVYQSSIGPVNSGAVSTFMRHAVISENRLTAIPDGVPRELAVLFGCALLTGAMALFNAFDAQKGGSVAVFGTGGVGLSALMMAKALGADPIIAVDVNDGKKQTAVELGATAFVNPNDRDAVEAILDLTDGRGVDVALEAAGVTSAMEAAFSSVRNGGGQCILAGNPAHGEKIALDPFDLIKGKTIRGTWGGESDPDRDIPRLAELYRQGQLGLEKLIANCTYPFEAINQAIDDLEHGRCIRPVIDLRDA